MRIFLTCFLVCLITAISYGQQREKINIKGKVVDSTGAPLASATVMFLKLSDSTLIQYGRSDEQGLFSLKNVKNQPGILKISYVGYLPHEEILDHVTEETLEFGNIVMQPMNHTLFEVVIKEAKAPMSIRGDTIEYNASSFKVPEGSTVEDLLRKLPGVNVDKDGNIKAQGEDVTKVTVDGKTFFGTDPKVATKTLPAEAISKVQVFNEKSDQAKVTGVDDGKQEKTLNLELKEDFKKGLFGKAEAGVGSENTWMGKGNLNKFNKNEQISIIGFGNNINESGMGWDDMNDFKGGRSFNKQSGDFGFESGGERYFYYSSDDDQNGIDISPSWGQSGLSKNFGGGINYNYDNTKLKAGGYYYFNRSNRTRKTTSFNQYFIPDRNYSTDVVSDDNAITQNHRLGVEVEENIDSSNVIFFYNSTRVGINDQINISNSRYLNSDLSLKNASQINNNSDANVFETSNTLIYRHKFKQRPGRAFAISGNYYYKNSGQDKTQRSDNQFYNPDSTSSLHLLNDDRNISGLVKGSLLYVEPIGKKFFAEVFYNTSYTDYNSDHNVYQNADINQRDDTLSRYVLTNTFYNRVGVTGRYVFKGLNIAVGIAGQNIDIYSKNASSKSAGFNQPLDKGYFNISPYFSFNYRMKGNKSIRLNYSNSYTAPSIQNLQPIVDNSNPLFIKVGNPGLNPTNNHNINLNFNKFNPANNNYMWLSSYYSLSSSGIIESQTIDSNLVTRSISTNVSGGNYMGLYGGYGLPVIKEKLKLDIYTGINSSKNLTYLNDVLNTGKTLSYNGRLGFDITPIEALIFYLSIEGSISDSKYSVSNDRNSKYKSAEFSANMSLKLPGNIFIAPEFEYSYYENSLLADNVRLPILDLSAYTLILKKKMEVRLSMYDVFNKRQNIRQNAGFNSISQTSTITLGRYFMVSVAYNLKGITAEHDRN